MFYIDITVKHDSTSGVSDSVNDKTFHFDKLSPEFIQGFKFSHDVYTSNITSSVYNMSFTTNLPAEMPSQIYVMPPIEISYVGVQYLQSKSRDKRQKIWNKIFDDRLINYEFKYIGLLSYQFYIYREMILFNSVDVLNGIKTFSEWLDHNDISLDIVAVLDVRTNISYQVQYYYQTNEILDWNESYRVYPTGVLCLRKLNVVNVIITMILKYLIGNKLKLCESPKFGIGKCMTKTSNNKHYCRMSDDLIEKCNFHYGTHRPFRKCNVCSTESFDPSIAHINLIEFDN
jgi:hypothetical protein